MFAELCRYGITYKNLPVPGIGTFAWETIPATTDFPNKLVYPPSYRVRFVTSSHVPSAAFFRWLSQALGVSDREAVFRFNDFAFDLNKKVHEGAVIHWQGVGTLQKGLGTEIRFSPELPELLLQEPVPALKIIRENAEHLVRVGEEHKTSGEMTALLSETVPDKRSFQQVIALALLLLAVLFTGWHLSEHGLDTGAAANNKQMVPGKAPVTYRLLPG